MPRALLEMASVVVCASWVAAASFPAEAWDFVLPHAEVVAGVDWSRVRSSLVGAWLKEELARAATPEPLQGFLEAVDQVVLSVEPDIVQRGASRVVMALGGRFDWDALRRMVSRKLPIRRSVGDIEVWLGPEDGGDRLALARVRPRWVLIGDWRGVESCLRNCLRRPQLAGLAGRARQISQQADAWIVATPRSKVSWGGDRTVQDWLEDVRELHAVVRVDRGLDLAVWLAPRNPSATSEWRDLLATFVELASARARREGARSGWLEKMQVQQSGDTIQLTVHLGPEDLLEALGEVTGVEWARLGVVRHRKGPGWESRPPEQLVSPSEGPMRRAIRVYGLENTPVREVYYQTR